MSSRAQGQRVSFSLIDVGSSLPTQFFFSSIIFSQGRLDRLHTRRSPMQGTVAAHGTGRAQTGAQRQPGWRCPRAAHAKTHAHTHTRTRAHKHTHKHTHPPAGSMMVRRCRGTLAPMYSTSHSSSSSHCSVPMCTYVRVHACIQVCLGARRRAGTSVMCAYVVRLRLSCQPVRIQALSRQGITTQRRITSQ